MQTLLSEPTVAAVQESARDLRDLLGHLSELAHEQGAEVARLTASLNRSASELEAAAGTGEDWARAVARADSALATVNRTSQTLLRVSSSLENILERMEAGEGTLGQLSTDSSLYTALTDAAQSIGALAEDIKAHPGRYVRVEIF